MDDELLQTYAWQFYHMNRYSSNYILAPHKPVMLLSIIDLIEQGTFIIPTFEYDSILRKMYEQNWLRYVGEYDTFKPNPSTPFEYLDNEPFWEFHQKTDTQPMSASISSDLFNLLQDPAARASLRRVLICAIGYSRIRSVSTSNPAIPKKRYVRSEEFLQKLSEDAQKWKEISPAYKPVRQRIEEGWSQKEILEELDSLSSKYPSDYFSRSGKPITAAILSGWASQMGLSFTTKTDKWKATNAGFRWFREQILSGRPKEEIIKDFNELHKTNPADFSTIMEEEIKENTYIRWRREVLEDINTKINADESFSISKTENTTELERKALSSESIPETEIRPNVIIEHKKIRRTSGKLHTMPTTRLKIIFDDGHIIQEPNAADTLKEFIIEAGIMEVRALNLSQSFVPLVSNTLDARYSKAQKPLGNGWYLMTNSPTLKKKHVIEDIANKLGISLRVEIV